jgi:hypothetical protein
MEVSMAFPVTLDFTQHTYQGHGRIIRVEYTVDGEGNGEVYVTFRIPLEQITPAELRSLIKRLQDALVDYGLESGLTPITTGNLGLAFPVEPDPSEGYDDFSDLDDDDLGFTYGDYMP